MNVCWTIKSVSIPESDRLRELERCVPFHRSAYLSAEGQEPWRRNWLGLPTFAIRIRADRPEKSEQNGVPDTRDGEDL